MANIPRRFRPAPLGEQTDALRRQARIVPNMARSVIALAELRGIDPGLLCRGLGFCADDLQDPDLLLSHEQIRTLILRLLQVSADPGVGLAVGARQSPLSWGLAGLLMLTCKTLGEAAMVGLAHQAPGGSMVEQRLEQHGSEIHVLLVPCLPDPPIEQFLIEEGMTRLTNVTRQLLQLDREPAWIALAYPKPEHASAYRSHFRCPVHFGADAHRLVFQARQLAAPLPGYERLVCGHLRQLLQRLIPETGDRHELLASLTHQIRTSAEDKPRQVDLAQQVNISQRTLRRRLSGMDTSFRALRDEAAYAKARELLRETTMAVAEVATALGYADARSFRRAFQRWSGKTPADFRRTG